MLEKSQYRQWQDGDITYAEYKNNFAREKGFKDYNDYQNYRNHINRKNKPMSENKNCSKYLGVVVAEKILSKIFKDVEVMPHNNPGFDFFCNKRKKIDCKRALFHSPVIFKTRLTRINAGLRQ